MNKLIGYNTLRHLKSGANLAAALRARASVNSSLYHCLAPSANLLDRHLVLVNDGLRSLHTSIRFNQETSKAADSAEKTVGSPEKYDFLAETKQLLNIVAKSLYSEKEVFIRELISNSSDAIEKVKYAQLTGELAATKDAQVTPFEIQINANDMNNTLTIQVKIQLWKCQ